jgi:hypothetical protein
VTRGAPALVASKRYWALSLATYTPPLGSTAKEFPIASFSRFVRIRPLFGSITPTTPASLLTYQRRPRWSGSTEPIPSPAGTVELRS